MLKTKFNRHITAFLVITLASIFLYPVSQTGETLCTHFLLAMILLAAVLTLSSK